MRTVVKVFLGITSLVSLGVAALSVWSMQFGLRNEDSLEWVFYFIGLYGFGVAAVVGLPAAIGWAYMIHAESRAQRPDGTEDGSGDHGGDR